MPVPSATTSASAMNGAATMYNGVAGGGLVANALLVTPQTLTAAAATRTAKTTTTTTTNVSMRHSFGLSR